MQRLFINNYPDRQDPTFTQNIMKQPWLLDGPDQYGSIILKDYQKVVINMVDWDTPYTRHLVYHKMGSGKTIIAVIAAVSFIQKTGKRVYYFSPNNKISTVFEKDLDKCFPNDKKEIMKKVDFNSFEAFSNSYMKKKVVIKDSLVIIDEAHNLRTLESNGSKIYESFLELLGTLVSSKLLLMTGTPVRDSWEDFVNIINLLVPSHERLTTVNKKNIEYIKTLLRGRTSTHLFTEANVKMEYQGNTEIPENMKLVSIPLSTSQQSIILSQGSGNNMAVAKYYVGYFNNESFFSGLNQSNVYQRLEETSPKYAYVLKGLERSVASIVFGKYTTGPGLKAMARVLDSVGYKPYTENSKITRGADGKYPKGKRYIYFDGQSSVKTFNEALEVFNSEDNKDGQVIKTIIGSESISEGYNIMNVQDIYILNPYWNFTTVDQVISRGLRLNSHRYLENGVLRVHMLVCEAPGCMLERDMYNACLKKDRDIKYAERIMWYSSYNKISKDVPLENSTLRDKLLMSDSKFRDLELYRESVIRTFPYKDPEWKKCSTDLERSKYVKSLFRGGVIVPDDFVKLDINIQKYIMHYVLTRHPMETREAMYYLKFSNRFFTCSKYSTNRFASFLDTNSYNNFKITDYHQYTQQESQNNVSWAYEQNLLENLDSIRRSEFAMRVFPGSYVGRLQYVRGCYKVGSMDIDPKVFEAFGNPVDVNKMFFMQNVTDILKFTESSFVRGAWETVAAEVPEQLLIVDANYALIFYDDENAMYFVLAADLTWIKISSKLAFRAYEPIFNILRQEFMESLIARFPNVDKIYTGLYNSNVVSTVWLREISSSNIDPRIIGTKIGTGNFNGIGKEVSKKKINAGTLNPEITNLFNFIGLNVHDKYNVNMQQLVKSIMLQKGLLFSFAKKNVKATYGNKNPNRSTRDLVEH